MRTCGINLMENQSNDAADSKKKSAAKKEFNVVEFIEPFLLVTAENGQIFYRQFRKGETLAATEKEMEYLRDQRALIKIDGL